MFVGKIGLDNSRWAKIKLQNHVFMLFIYQVHMFDYLLNRLKLRI